MIARDAESNLALLEAMVEQLEPYLTAGEVTRKILAEVAGRRIHATMSVGILLNLIEWLQAVEPGLTASQRGRLAELLRRHESMRLAHRSDYGDLLERELKGDLDSWTWYVGALERGDLAGAEDYGSEVWLRTRSEQLLAEAARIGLDTADAAARLADLDARIRPMLVAAPFVGAAADGASRPADRYWWLYARPAGRDDS